MFSSGVKAIACKKKQNKTITPKTDLTLFSGLITVTRDDTLIFKMLFHISLVLFYPKGDIRKTSKSKVLKEVEITEYSKVSLLGYQYASVIDSNCY